VSELGAIVERVVAGIGDPDRREADISGTGITDAGYNFVTPRPRYIPDYNTPRFRLTPAHFGYLKMPKVQSPCSFA